MGVGQRVAAFTTGLRGRLTHFYYASNLAVLSTYVLIRPGVLAQPKGKDYVRGWLLRCSNACCWLEK